MEEKEYLLQDDEGNIPENEFTEEMKKAVKDYIEKVNNSNIG